MYLSIGTAKSKGTEQNQEYPILVFSLADTDANAKTLAVEHMQSTGWENVTIDKTDPVELEAIKKAQPEISDAYKLALNAGSHGMVIGKPT